MKAHTYNVLVLLDLKDNSEKLLKYTLALSKTMPLNIEFFSVRNPTEVIDTDSQLSAMRNINTNCIALRNELEQTLSPFFKNNGVKVKSTFALGNAKNHIEKRISACLPDIVIIGERKSKTLSFMGDHITDFLLRNYEGMLLVASNPESINSLEVLRAANTNNIYANSMTA